MSNADLIAEARSIVSWHRADSYSNHVYGVSDQFIEALADALEYDEKCIANLERELYEYRKAAAQDA